MCKFWAQSWHKVKHNAPLHISMALVKPDSMETAGCCALAHVKFTFSNCILLFSANLVSRTFQELEGVPGKGGKWVSPSENGSQLLPDLYAIFVKFDSNTNAYLSAQTGVGRCSPITLESVCLVLLQQRCVNMLLNIVLRIVQYTPPMRPSPRLNATCIMRLVSYNFAIMPLVPGLQ